MLQTIKQFYTNRPSLVVVIIVFLASMTAVTSAKKGNSKPIIKLNLPYHPGLPKGVLKFSEETPPNSLIGILTTQDKDNVRCETDNQFILLEEAAPKLYQIQLKRALDRELHEEIVVNILCVDDGVPAMTGTASFTIRVLDVNDNEPSFILNQYSAEVAENSDIGTLVVQVGARDMDDGYNGKVRYSLLPEVNNIFRIDATNGKIFTNVVFDRELVQGISFTVVATDSGEPSLSAKVNVTVAVTDVNDNAPVLLKEDIHVKENNKPMSIVHRLRGKDLDEGKNGEMVFSILDAPKKWSPELPFIVKHNGNVLAAASLDRERRSHYIMKILVRDKGKPKMSSTGTVTIFVDDVNDNTPEIMSLCLGDSIRPKRDTADNEVLDTKRNDSELVRDFDSIQTFENATAISDGVFDIPGFVSLDWHSPEEKKVLYHVKAIDADTGANQAVLYSIDAHNGERMEDEAKQNALFTINPKSGEMFLRRYLVRSDELSHHVVVSVRDNGKPSLVSTCALNVTFDIDVSDLPGESDVPMPPFSFNDEPSQQSGSSVMSLNFQILGVLYLCYFIF